MNNGLAYSTYGDPQRPAIAFLHGIRLGREIWEPHARALMHAYHIVTLDLPGHGANTGIPFTPEGIATTVAEVLATVSPSPPLIVGYSLGGYVAMQYAALHPERTRALLLSGCTLDFESWKSWPYEVTARLSQTIPESVLDWLMNVSLRLTLPRNWARLVSGIPFNRDVFMRTSALAHASKFSEKLKDYRKPVLFVNGEYDLIFRADERRFLNRVPQARLRILRGVDHTAPMRNVEEFTAIVREFATKVFG